ncbi:hypothetical protein KFE94_03845 [bacterium SCSIO 12643]|nr:hypothetical protein KFE94_03845 [bacterium SCSIO 12643]
MASKYGTMVSNDFKEENESLLTQMFDETTKGFGIFWVVLALAAIFSVVIGIIA